MCLCLVSANFRCDTWVTLSYEMNSYIFDVHIDCCFVTSPMGSWLCLLEMGPLNMIDKNVLAAVKMVVRGMSTAPVSWGWWRDFSTWRDYIGLRRVGIRLPMHDVIEGLNRKLGKVEGVSAFVKNIDDNGNLEIGVMEFTQDGCQCFTVGARRRRLRRLKDIAAYNIAQSLDGPDGIDELKIMASLKNSIKMYVLKMSGDYLTEMCRRKLDVE